MSMPRIAAASMVGTALEYYDFAVYNSLAALVFNRIFFPSFDPLSGTLLAFSTYAVGYVARPVGGAIFGRLGDTRGRRQVLVTTLMLMGLTTVAMGLLPTYASAGVWSPVLLVALRFVQGAALGGEWAGAVLLSVEHGRQDRRGLNAAWAQAGPSAGTLLATGLIAGITLGMSADAFQGWGWRIPFLLSAVLVGFGLWVRVGVSETPVFNELVAHRELARAPLGLVLRDHWRRLLIAGGSRIGSDVMYSLLAAFTLTYLTSVLHQSRPLALGAISVGVAVNAASIPLCGWASDRFGRRKVGGFGVVLAVGWGFAYFRMLQTLEPAWILAAVISGFVIHAFLYGPQAAFITEQFPTRVRFSGSSIAYTWAGVFGGGIAPLVCASLLRADGSTLALSVYLGAALSVTGVALLAARETAYERLQG